MDVFKILVIRLSAMGDVAMTVPVVGELRAKYPQAQIVILTNPSYKPFFRDIDNLQFFEPDLRGRHKGLRGLWKLSRDVWGEFGGFDMIADMHDVLRSMVLRQFFRLAGAKIAIIDKGRDGRFELTRFTGKVLKPLRTTIERYSDVLDDLGLEVDIPKPSVAPLPRRSNVKPLDETALNLTDSHDSKWLGIAPFAKHAGKIYPLDLMEEVISQLSSESDHKLFIFGGGKEEAEFAEEMAERYPRTVSMIGKLDLGRELDVISNLDIMLSMDSASMHMASLMGVPVVSVWGATHPYAGFYGFGQDPANAVQLDLPCRPCSVYGNKPCIIGGYPCLNDISPETIVAKITDRLGDMH